MATYPPTTAVQEIAPNTYLLMRADGYQEIIAGIEKINSGSHSDSIPQLRVLLERMLKQEEQHYTNVLTALSDLRIQIELLKKGQTSHRVPYETFYPPSEFIPEGSGRARANPLFGSGVPHVYRRDRDIPPVPMRERDRRSNRAESPETRDRRIDAESFP